MSERDRDRDGNRYEDDECTNNDRRKDTYDLNERQMQRLAEKIADIVAPKAALMAKQLVLDEIAITVGRGIISRLAWAVGLAFIAVALWLAGTGHIKP